MTDRPNVGRRAARLIAFSIGGGVALAIAMASSSSAQEVVVQDAEVTNVGAAAANSGGNVAVGNASDNEATTDQTAVGLVASNAADTSNASDGTASITTGAATATGTQSTTGVAQSVTGGGTGPTVAVQDSDVVNAGAGVANSGLNAAVGNASDNAADTDQTALGVVASNAAATSNASNGTASITTGPATATGNSSTTGILQTTDAGDGGGLLVAVQDADVVNAGFGLANSGLNLAVGNASENTAPTTQVAIGLLASNAAGTGNTSDGTATITTGSATGIGNQSGTGIAQAVSSDPGGLAVVVQSDTIVDVGAGFANSGFNAVLGNVSTNVSPLVQVAIGLIASNASGGGDASDGSAVVLTGNAWAIGNDSWTGVSQTA